MSWFIVQVINRQKAELLRTREKLVQSENLALVGELAAGVAHEINNPIGIISTYSDFLTRNAAPDDERRKDYEVIHAEASRCEAIVKELLTYARPAGRDIVPVDLVKLNDEVLEFVSRRIGQGNTRPEVARDYEQRLPWPLVDPTQLKQALLNIYLNAFQALEGTANAHVTARIRKDEAANQVNLCVEDNGPGIAPEDLRRIFDPFFTTRARGTGLGLSITRRLVEACGGEVHVRSKKGTGTTVELRLPID
jgi:two-component system NtrC family sensor kinase